MKQLKNPAASVRTRLLAHAKARGEEFQRVLTRYAIERLLYRLAQTDPADRYVLKGAMLFVTWPEHIFRPTGDLDLLGHGDPHPDSVRALFGRACGVVLEADGMVFDAATIQVETVREADKYEGVRLRLVGALGSARTTVHVDIGFGDHVHPQPERRAFPSLLPELPTPVVFMYPPESVVAEKLDAVIRFGLSNGRAKDFYDLWIAARSFRFDLAELVEAVRGTLTRRETTFPTEMPVGLTDAYAREVAERGLWTGFLRRTAPTLEPPSFSQLQAELRRFLGPVIASLPAPTVARRSWDHGASAWGP